MVEGIVGRSEIKVVEEMQSGTTAEEKRTSCGDLSPDFASLQSLAKALTINLYAATQKSEFESLINSENNTLTRYLSLDLDNMLDLCNGYADALHRLMPTSKDR